MPNWCSNRIEISGDGADRVSEKLEKEAAEFDSALLLGDDLLPSNDIRLSSFDLECIQEDGGIIVLEGLTAWKQPSDYCMTLSKLYDCEVRLLYAEPNENFSGCEVYENGEEIVNDRRDTVQTDYGRLLLQDTFCENGNDDEPDEGFVFTMQAGDNEPEAAAKPAL